MTQATISSQENEILQEASDVSLSEKVKRAFDILFSSVFLLAASPLFVTLFLLVGCTSKGPILYRSVRLGRGGKVIHCWKFRTMYADADARLELLLKRNPELRHEWEVYQKLKNDPRVTRVGRFLRKSSLDEFPQFWNVLRGDLSIVGPRPPTLVGPPALYLKELHGIYGPSTFRILSVRPGITGPWQVSGRSKIPMEKRRKLEEEYAKTHGFWSDLLIIAKTIPAVFFSRGAC
ncbi:MAG TPA: sugar transferase [Chlamydiales bacterium]|jgi:undecaprenyl-phosphate galactose phosphotransferase